MSLYWIGKNIFADFIFIICQNLQFRGQQCMYTLQYATYSKCKFYLFSWIVVDINQKCRINFLDGHWFTKHANVFELVTKNLHYTNNISIK